MVKVIIVAVVQNYFKLELQIKGVSMQKKTIPLENKEQTLFNELRQGPCKSSKWK